MILIRLGLLCVLLCSGVVAEARRGLNDSGNCVEACSLGAGEPCPPCPPRAAGGRVPGDVLDRYRVDVGHYESEMRTFTERNSQLLGKDRLDVGRTRTLNARSLADSLGKSDER